MLNFFFRFRGKLFDPNTLSILTGLCSSSHIQVREKAKFKLLNSFRFKQFLFTECLVLKFKLKTVTKKIRPLVGTDSIKFQRIRFQKILEKQYSLNKLQDLIFKTPEGPSLLKIYSKSICDTSTLIFFRWFALPCPRFTKKAVKTVRPFQTTS